MPAALLEVAPRVRSRIGIDRDLVDVTTDDGARLPRRSSGVDLTVVFQTAVLGYLAHEDTKPVYAALDEAATSRPLAYVGTHAPAADVHTHYGLAIRIWPAGRELVALADFHGAWIDWLAASA